MREKINTPNFNNLQELLMDPEQRNALVERGLLRLVPTRSKKELRYQPTEKLIEMLEKENGQKYCRECLLLDPKDYKRRVLFRNLLGTFEQNGFEWEGRRLCPHRQEENPRKPHTIIASGSRKIALELVMGRRYSASYEDLLEQFETYHDVQATLCCVEDPDFLEWFIPKAADYPRIYFAAYGDVIRDFETARAFQANRPDGIELEMLLLFPQKDGGRA